jgi:hypothetical protein
MHTYARKALIGLALLASCSVALTPKSAEAQTTLPTVIVVGRRPQSREAIDRFFDQAREASLRTEILEFVGILDEPGHPQQNLTLYTIDCRLSQNARTSEVTRALSIPLSATPGDSTYLAFGTEVTVNYMNGSASERFFVTSGGGGGAPGSSGLLRELTPVAGSLVCPP